MERTAQNRVIFGANAKKEKSRNPHGYWIFRWRSGWDSNPRAREDYLISSQARYDHFDTAPYMFSRHFFLPFSGEKGLWKELTERTANLFNFRTVENPHGYKVFGGRNGQLPARFRVSPVMTASIPLHVGQDGLCAHRGSLYQQIAGSASANWPRFWGGAGWSSQRHQKAPEGPLGLRGRGKLAYTRLPSM